MKNVLGSLLVPLLLLLRMFIFELICFLLVIIAELKWFRWRLNEAKEELAWRRQMRRRRKRDKDRME